MELETRHLLTFITVPTDSIYVVNYLHPFYHYNCSVAAFTTGLGPSAHFVVQTLPEGGSATYNFFTTEKSHFWDHYGVLTRRLSLFLHILVGTTVLNIEDSTVVIMIVIILSSRTKSAS